MEKSRDAFRTISEVAEWLDVPTHVLRFWESRFSQIKPVKRAGGRRYYRPSDMRLIGGVKTLLHDQGMTIRGVQKMLREHGLKHVSSYSPALFGDAGEEEVAAVVVEHRDAPPATPAAAARATREAEPAPVEDETAAESAEAEVSAAPLFSHRRAVSEQKSAPGAGATPEAPAPTIPPTPDVPDTDPGDDDDAHARGPGAAALLRLAGRARLGAHRADLAAAAKRLKALIDRVS